MKVGDPMKRGSSCVTSLRWSGGRSNVPPRSMAGAPTFFFSFLDRGSRMNKCWPKTESACCASLSVIVHCRAWAHAWATTGTPPLAETGRTQLNGGVRPAMQFSGGHVRKIGNKSWRPKLRTGYENRNSNSRSQLPESSRTQITAQIFVPEIEPIDCHVSKRWPMNIQQTRLVKLK